MSTYFLHALAANVRSHSSQSSDRPLRCAFRPRFGDEMRRYDRAATERRNYDFRPSAPLSLSLQILPSPRDHSRVGPIPPIFSWLCGTAGWPGVVPAWPVSCLSPHSIVRPVRNGGIWSRAHHAATALRVDGLGSFRS